MAHLSGSIPVDLIVIQGESNAAGRADNASALPSELAPRSAVQILNNDTMAFEDIDIGTNNNLQQYVDPLTDHGMELALTNEVEAGRLRNPTYLVKCGASGSYIAQWLPNSTRGLWEDYIPFVDKSVELLQQSGTRYRIAVWQSLGLNDRYGQNTDPLIFKAGMQLLRDDFRARFGNDIHFFSTNFHNPPAHDFTWNSLWTDMSVMDSRFHSISVMGATYIDGNSHYDYDGFKLISHNMVTAMQTVLGVDSFAWSKVSGPSGNVTFAPGNSLVVTASGLHTGAYVFRLTVTNTVSGSSSADVRVVVQ